MKFSSLLLLCSVCFTALAQKDEFLTGKWCVGEDGLVLTFKGNDSLMVSSRADESVSGNGTFKKTDTSFTAVVKNGDMTMEMKYRYRRNGKDTVDAQAEMFTINGDSVSFPAEWMSMVRCAAPEQQKSTVKK